ncbi:MAG: ATP-binding protein [Pseudomonadota bacterium]
MSVHRWTLSRRNHLNPISPSPLYLIPPTLSLVIGLGLAAVALRKGMQQAESRLFAIICIWWSLLAPVFICHHFVDSVARILIIERSVHFFYVFLPPLTVAFIHQIVGVRRLWLTRAAFIISAVIALFTPTELYINGLYEFSWGYIARGGPVFQVFGIYCLATLVYMATITVSRLRRETNPVRRQKIAYIALSLCAMGFLTILNIPAMNGIDFYPVGNLTFVPLGIMAYGVLRYRLLNIQSMMLRSLLWLMASSVIIVLNLLLVTWFQPSLTRIGTNSLVALLAAWFAFNYAYISKIQPLIDRLFDRRRRHLRYAADAFMTDAASLKGLENLASELQALVARHLGIQKVSVFLVHDGDGELENPISGDRLVLSETILDLLVNRAKTVERAMVETHPAYAASAPEILALMDLEKAGYLLPLIQKGRILGLMLLSAPASGRSLEPHELRFLDRLSTAGIAFANAAVFQRVADLKAALESRSDELIREIQERERIADALRSSEKTMRLMADNVRDVLWTMDMNLAFTYISPSVEKMRGWTPEEFLALPLERILTPPSMEKALSILAETLDKGEATGDYSRDAVLGLVEYCKSGKTIHTEATAAFIVGADGRPTGILGITRDISERVHAQSEKERLQEQLARSKKMEALGLLAGGVAHDLNNILSGLTSFPELLLEELPADSDLRESLEIITDCGQRAAAVVGDLVTIARGVASPRKTASLNHVVEGYLASATHAALRANHPRVIFDCRLDPLLLNMSCSPFHMEKVLMNLLANAAEALTDGGSVQVTTENQYVDRPLKGYTQVEIGEYCVLRIVDNGPGISPADLERIFEPFYTRKVMGRSGTGLGLSVVWNTVQDHNGYIRVDSSPGGTRFELYFPGTRDEIDMAPANLPRDSITGNGETVLVIDDEPNQCKIAVGILNHLGYRATAVQTGEAAIAYLRDHDVALLLLDMVMPSGMDGRKTYEAVCRIRPGQKAVIASGFSETENVHAVQQMGAGPFVKKPYRIETLGLAVKNTLAANPSVK